MQSANALLQCEGHRLKILKYTTQSEHLGGEFLSRNQIRAIIVNKLYLIVNEYGYVGK